MPELTDNTDYTQLEEAAEFLMSSPVFAGVLQKTAKAKRLAAPAMANVSAAQAASTLDLAAPRAAGNSMAPEPAPWAGPDFISWLVVRLLTLAANRIGDSAPADVQEGETWVLTSTSGWTLNWRKNGADIPLFTLSNTGALALSSYLTATDANALAGTGAGLISAAQLKASMDQFGNFGNGVIVADDVSIDTILKTGSYFVSANNTSSTHPFPHAGIILEVRNVGSNWISIQIATELYGGSFGRKIRSVGNGVSGGASEWQILRPANGYSNATPSADGLMSAADKAKLDRYPTNGYSNATTSAAGLMSAADKQKLDGLSGFPAPNYGSSVFFSVTINGSAYTVPENGYIEVSFLAGNTNLLINGVSISGLIPIDSDFVRVTSQLCPVRQGDLVRVTSTSSTGQATGTLYRVRT